jgi:3-hydroxybutyryl-CoA dehydrogenase
MKTGNIKELLIIGAGKMGQQIGFISAMHGYDVVLYDVNTDLLDRAAGRIKKISDEFVMSGRLTREEGEIVLSRIKSTVTPEEAGAKADIISESAPEDPELKGKIFAQFNKICPPHTVFTTNTSTLVPSMFAEATGRPDRFAALHFHDIRMTDLVDIMPHPGTSAETIEIIENFAASIGQNYVTMKKEKSGYVFNTMLSAWFESAEGLAANGIASVDDVDRSWMSVLRVPMGPFGMMDIVGLETVWKINDFWAKKLDSKKYRTVADFIKKYLDEGKYGLKSGEGFYKYPDPEYAKPDFVSRKKS